MNLDPQLFEQKVGVVVPTLGERPDYLLACLESVQASGIACIVLVSPERIPAAESLISRWVKDPKAGLSKAINLGIQAMPNEIEFVTWLGDDDELFPENFPFAVEALANHPEVAATFGDVDYLDANGVKFWTNQTGAWAVPLMRFGPNRVPQPGSLIRRNALEEAGGVDEGLKFAMDLDMFIRLSKVGKLLYLNFKVARYRWHSGSLSAGNEWRSLQESSQVRLKHCPKLLRPLLRCTEALQITIAGSKQSRLDRLSK